MKKFLKYMVVALAAIMTLSLTSCNDDDDDEPNSGYADIIGSWECTDCPYMNIPNGHYELFFQFHADGTMREVVISNYFVPDWPIETDTSEGTWEIIDGHLYVTIDDEIELNGASKILKCTKNNLELEILSSVFKFKKISDSKFNQYFD